MSLLDPFAKPNPASDHERFDPTQGDMKQVPEREAHDSLQSQIARLTMAAEYALFVSRLLWVAFAASIIALVIAAGGGL